MPPLQSCAVKALAAAVLLAGLAQAEDSWKKKAAEWTVEEALKVVLDSPWAHEEMVAMGLRALASRRDPNDPLNRPLPSPRTGGPGVPPPRPLPFPTPNPTAAYLVRWESANAVAEAFARLEELGERTSAQFQAPPPRRPDNRYVITVKTTQPPPRPPDLFDNMSPRQLRERAKLKTRGIEVAPVEVERSGVGATAAVHFFFARTHQGNPLLVLDRQEFEFRFDGRRSTLKSKFKLERQEVR